MRQVARKITLWLKDKGEIETEDTELYEYGISEFISYLLGFLITVALGFAFSLALEATIFFFAFKALREYAGGFHASTQFRCSLISLSTVVIFFILLRFLPASALVYVIIALPSTLLVFFLAPIEAINKPITNSEKIAYKKRARIILLIIAAVMISLELISWHQLASCLALVIIFNALQMLVAVISLHRKSTKEAI